MIKQSDSTRANDNKPNEKALRPLIDEQHTLLTGYIETELYKYFIMI